MTTMAPPISPQPTMAEARPRAVTSMSYTSNRSRRSSGSGHKLELTESAKDKKRLHTKADPSRALNEATPAEQAQEHATVDDLRGIMHKDYDGNVITDPDRSNPTRNRMERPLDTIRAFNAAAEGTSFRRTSYNQRSPSQVGWNNSHTNDNGRRASYYSNNGYSPQRQQRPTPGGGYYRNSSYGFGAQSSVEEEPGSAQMNGRHARGPGAPYYGHGGYHNGHPNGYHNGHQQYGNHDSPTSAHSYQHSYETATSGSDDYSKSTNPSSQNSSNDQLPHLRKAEDPAVQSPYANDIRFNSQSPADNFQLHAPGQNPYGSDAVQPPGAPVHSYGYPAGNNPRVPIKLNSSSDATVEKAPAPPPKRQSWIKRTFSRRET